MFRRLLFLLLAMGCAAPKPSVVVLPTVAYPFSRAVLTRDDVAACTEHILSLAWYGQVDWERAAFLRIAGNGRFTCDVWPAKLQFRSARWDGAIPDGTVALVHSHPRTLPDPSGVDVERAHQLGIPVIVVTPDSVVMVLPHDGMLIRVPHDPVTAAHAP
jgi:hypothetical protein